MIKFTIILRRRKDLTHEQFVEHHRNVHAPLFRSIPEVQQHVRRYVQCHATGDQLPGFRPPASMVRQSSGLTIWQDWPESSSRNGTWRSSGPTRRAF